eukprot:6141516-Prymnesium_polylepis.1
MALWAVAAGRRHGAWRGGVWYLVPVRAGAGLQARSAGRRSPASAEGPRGEAPNKCSTSPYCE